MSVAALVARDLMLTSRNSDLTFQINLLTENVLQLTAIAARIVSAAAVVAPNSPGALQLRSREAAIAQINKALEVQLANLRAQQRAVVTERESVRKAITENINSSFKTFG